MRDTMLERHILKILSRVEPGLREPTLQDEVEIAADRPLTTIEFTDSIKELQSRKLVARKVTILGESLWKITDLGRTALKGA